MSTTQDIKHFDEVRIEDTRDSLYKTSTGNPITLYRTYSAQEAAEIERKLVRKLDTRILPFIVLIYILNYVCHHFQACRKT